MPVRDSLVLDHFYIDASADDFEAMKELADVFSATAHHKVQAEGDSWEGLYFYTRAGSYFEILRERREHSLGLCFSPFDSMKVDASKITSELDLDWKTLVRNFADGSPWFDALSVNPNPFKPDTLFDAWIMKYHRRHVDWPRPPVPRSIDRFETLSLSLGRDNVDEIRKLSEWFPGSRLIDDKRIIFEFPDRDACTFTVTIDLVDGMQRFLFRELTMKHCSPERFDNFAQLRLNNFLLVRDGERLKLSFGNSTI